VVRSEAEAEAAEGGRLQCEAQLFVKPRLALL